MSIIDTNRNVAAHLAHLKARGVTTIGRYYASSAAKRLTRPEAAAICAAGLDIFVVFEDSGDPQLSVEQGVHDAQIALGQAHAIGQPAGSAIYFALEHEKQGGFTQAHVPGIKRYMDGVRQVLAPTYKIGVYGDGVVCKALLDAQMVDFTWLSASRKHPGTPEFTASGRATLIQGTPVDQNIDGLSVDFNEAKQPEFGAFTVPAAQPAPAPGALALMPAAEGAAPPIEAAFAAAAGDAAAAPLTALPGGWTILVQRLREELRRGKGFRRTVGTYQIYRDGVPVAGLSGMTVERQGPGDNGEVGKDEHRCIEAASYPLNTHDTENYSTSDYDDEGEHPRPAIEVGDTRRRTGILIHPASGYGSTIGCINLAGHLLDANSDFSLSDSTRRVIDVINDLKAFNGGTLPTGDGVAIARCHLVVRDVAAAGVAVAPHGMVAAMAFEALAQGQPVGNPVPFDTEASRSGNKWGSSETRGLHGTRQKFDDGSIVIDATEALSATRSDGLDATLSATQHRVEKDDVVAVVQMNYSYRNRTLPNAMLMRVAGDFPAQVPAGFTATVVRSVGASQFGKKDREDEGTGSPLMGLIQTNSDVFGASIKASAMARAFGAGWKANPQRLNALIEVLFPARNRLVRVPLVDVGPHEDTDERSYPEVDLTLSCDEFLGTHGQARVKYRILLPS